jgi:PPK2 family polyphosphate:nucleotide phosphotransferase
VANDVPVGLKSLLRPYRIDDGRKFSLRDHDPAAVPKQANKKRAVELLPQGIDALAKMQDMLYAQNLWAILLIFQAMDAAGKDGVIKHVMSGINPQGCQVYSFKQPSAEELDHDYLWRSAVRMPERGRIGIFNRSYYEEVLVVRVHKELLDRQHIPPKLVTKRIWRERYEDISSFEHYLSRNGIVIRKFFLHLSHHEQKRRFLKRLEDGDKNWKFSISDAAEREHWNEYMEAYDEMIRHTATPYAPWFVVPADKKWFTRIVVAAAVVDAMRDLDLHYPKVDKEKRKELVTARHQLLQEKS